MERKTFQSSGDFTDPVKVFNDFFFFFFDNDVIQMIVTYSKLYVRSKGNNTFSSELYKDQNIADIFSSSGRREVRSTPSP